MGYKIKGALKKSKWVFIVGIGLWIIISIVLGSCIAVSKVEAEGTENIAKAGDFISNFLDNIGNVKGNLSKVFKSDYFPTYLKTEAWITGFILLFTVVGLIKSMPKNEYTGIENGSSDWATGEQYSVLSKSKGILLAENHYLPVNKRGNVNVLVVGRIRFSENLHHMLYQMLTNY